MGRLRQARQGTTVASSDYCTVPYLKGVYRRIDGPVGPISEARFVYSTHTSTVPIYGASSLVLISPSSLVLLVLYMYRRVYTEAQYEYIGSKQGRAQNNSQARQLQV